MGVYKMLVKTDLEKEANTFTELMNAIFIFILFSLIQNLGNNLKNNAELFLLCGPVVHMVDWLMPV